MDSCNELFAELIRLWAVPKSELVGLPWFNVPNVTSVSGLFGTGDANKLETKLAVKDVVSNVAEIGKTTGKTMLIDGTITVKVTPKVQKMGEVYTISISFKTLGYGKEWKEFLLGWRKAGSTVAYIAYTTDGQYYVLSPADDTRPVVKDEVQMGNSSVGNVSVEMCNVQGAVVVES